MNLLNLRKIKSNENKKIIDNKIRFLNKILYENVMKNNYNVYYFFIIENDNIFKITNINRNKFIKFSISENGIHKFYDIYLNKNEFPFLNEYNNFLL